MPGFTVDPAPVVVSIGPDHAVATWKGFLIQIWRHGTTLDAAKKVRGAAARLAVEQKGPIATLVVVEPGASLPDRDARAQLAGMVSDQRVRMAGAAMVHEGEGFRAAAVRAVVTGLMTMARNPFPHHVTATVAEACTWFDKDRRLPASDLVALPHVVEQLRAAIG